MTKKNMKEGNIRTKKIIVALTIFLLFATTISCSPVYNLNNFVLPDDVKFLAVVESLNTPEKICKYMDDNFDWEFYALSYSPYQMWLVNSYQKKISSKKGDCNDYSCFAVFVAHYHGYETYQIFVSYYDEKYAHILGVFVEGSYTYSSNWYYFPIKVNSFKEIVEHHCFVTDRKLKFYRVYDYEMNFIQEGGE